MKNRGFTLIELMVVISVISLLSSTVMYSTAQARMKADDAKKKTEIRQVETAIAIKKTSTGRVPKNYNCAGSFCLAGNGTASAAEGTEAFDTSMRELVTEGYLSAIPNSKDDSYVYYADPSAQTAAFGAKLAAGTAQPAHNRCTAIPAPLPYNDCRRTYELPPPNDNQPYYSGPDVVNFYYPETDAFCSTYGVPSCNPGGNGQYPLACPYGFLCIVPAVHPIISCTLNTSSASVCTGSGNDFCACVE